MDLEIDILDRVHGPPRQLEMGRQAFDAKHRARRFPFDCISLDHRFFFRPRFTGGSIALLPLTGTVGRMALLSAFPQPFKRAPTRRRPSSPAD